ncbi:hypothetical protein [Hoeflea sp.]|uniref:hypothetical protein n=1 Tax=Hoeflea sp. TaxID=1940281 RepID=UPI003B52EFE4
MKENHLSPAKEIVAILGGPKNVATITGRDITRVYRWMMPKKEKASHGGTGGTIPASEWPGLLKHAASNNIDLRAEDFFSGDRLAAVLAAQASEEAAS